jgi:hypothetical protein
MIQWRAQLVRSVLVDLEAQLGLVVAVAGLTVVLTAGLLEGPEVEAERLVEAENDVAVAG